MRDCHHMNNMLCCTAGSGCRVGGPLRPAASMHLCGAAPRGDVLQHADHAVCAARRVVRAHRRDGDLRTMTPGTTPSAAGTHQTPLHACNVIRYIQEAEGAGTRSQHRRSGGPCKKRVPAPRGGRPCACAAAAPRWRRARLRSRPPGPARLPGPRPPPTDECLICSSLGSLSAVGALHGQEARSPTPCCT